MLPYQFNPFLLHLQLNSLDHLYADTLRLQFFANLKAHFGFIIWRVWTKSFLFVNHNATGWKFQCFLFIKIKLSPYLFKLSLRYLSWWISDFSCFWTCPWRNCNTSSNSSSDRSPGAVKWKARFENSTMTPVLRGPSEEHNILIKYIQWSETNKFWESSSLASSN